MTEATRRLFARALGLPPVEKVRLARTLLESIDLGDDEDEHEVSPEWRGELERRASDEDPQDWIPGEKLMGKLKRAQRRDEAKARPKRTRGA